MRTLAGGVELGERVRLLEGEKLALAGFPNQRLPAQRGSRSEPSNPIGVAPKGWLRTESSTGPGTA